jgi:monofunctional biosynthetic peptidoglycan transglycosylase
VAEWGDGIYGAGAAARHYFGKGAGELTRREAALLASALDAPRESDPARPTRELAARAERIEKRLNTGGPGES